ncbi:MAG TPA: NnrU family protein [Methyloceanibacter sp.]|nr:NnrU family protein [Methyloceanibacter sp.]
MTLLIIGIIVFLGIHLLPTFPHFRERLIGSLGETGYKAAFGVLSIAGFVLLVWGFGSAPFIQVWSPPPWTRWVAIVLMLPAFIFLVAAYVPGRIKAKVKHPFLVAIKTWALAHLIANGDLASIILFGSFLAYAVYDRIALKGRQPTELIGTAAQGGTRNDLIAVVFGLLFYVIFLVWLHPLLIGQAVVPH